jgi:hypothetical protein
MVLLALSTPHLTKSFRLLTKSCKKAKFRDKFPIRGFENVPLFDFAFSSERRVFK